MTKRRIAILISLMLAAPAAVVALEQAASTGETAEVSQPAQEAQTEPANAPEQVAVTEQQPAPVAQAEPAGPIGRILGAFQRATPSDAFPEGSMYGDYHWKPLPNQGQYFASLEQRRATLIARHDAFPMGSATGEEFSHQPLPSQLAYFDRKEQPMIASSQPQPVASSEQSAQAGSAEVAMADTSAIR
jgi:hypothetical protein